MWSNGFISASKLSVWEQTTHNGETPLFLAVSSCLLENVSFLLLNGCNPNTKNVEGNSPLLTGKLTPWLWRTVCGPVSPLDPGASQAVFWCIVAALSLVPTDHMWYLSPKKLCINWLVRWGKVSAQLWAGCLAWYPSWTSQSWYEKYGGGAE